MNCIRHNRSYDSQFLCIEDFINFGEVGGSEGCVGEGFRVVGDLLYGACDDIACHSHSDWQPGNILD